MLECCMEVWFKINIMLNSGNLSQAPGPHARERGQEVKNVLPCVFLLAADVEIFFQCSGSASSFVKLSSSELLNFLAVPPSLD